MSMKRFVLAGVAAIGLPSSTAATVYFENTGVRTGFQATNIQHKGTVTTVTSPSYKSGQALRFYQEFDGSYTWRYHSEYMRTGAQLNHTDRYYGQALYLPTSWQWVDQNFTFQQFSPEDPSGPWIMNWIQLDQIRIRTPTSTAATSYTTRVVGTITRGVWNRLVMRLKMGDSGNLTYWINDAQRLNVGGNFNPRNSPSIRWSVGIYCTYWFQRTSLPSGNQTTRTLYQDQFRIASSFAEANAANWGGGTAPTPTPTPTPAPSGNVQLFQGCSYSGWSASFGPGNYTMADIQARGGVNDDASSIRVPSGYTVTLYTSDNFAGSSLVRTADDSCFTDNTGFNDTISSMRVVQN